MIFFKDLSKVFLIIGIARSITIFFYFAETNSDPIFTKGEKIALGLLSPFWVPVAIPFSLILLPVTVGVKVTNSIKDKKNMTAFKKDKVSFFEQWVNDVLNAHFTEETVRAKVYNHYFFSSLDRAISSLCEKHIPAQIAEDRVLVNDIAEDSRDTKELLELLQEIEKRLTKIQDHCDNVANS